MCRADPEDLMLPRYLSRKCSCCGRNLKLMATVTFRLTRLTGSDQVSKITLDYLLTGSDQVSRITLSLAWLLVGYFINIIKYFISLALNMCYLLWCYCNVMIGVMLLYCYQGDDRWSCATYCNVIVLLPRWWSVVVCYLLWCYCIVTKVMIGGRVLLIVMLLYCYDRRDVIVLLPRWWSVVVCYLLWCYCIVMICVMLLYCYQGDDRWSCATYCIDECALIKSLRPDTTYRFRVSAINQFGQSSYSWASIEIRTKKKGMCWLLFISCD